MNTFNPATYDLSDPRTVAAIDDLPLWSAPFGSKILDVVRMGKNLKVLDVGCGVGFPIVELSQRLGATCRCFGVDPWLQAIARVREKITAWGIGTLHMIGGVAEQLPFENEYFDVIISNNGINNVDDEKQAMDEISRVAKPGAQLVITVNLPETFVEFYNVFEMVLEEFDASAAERMRHHIDSKRKPLDYTKSLICSAGFEIQDIYLDEFIFRYTDAASMLDHFFIKLAFLPSWREVVKDENDRELVFKRVARELDEQASNNGELRLTVPWACLDAVRMV